MICAFGVACPLPWSLSHVPMWWYPNPAILFLQFYLPMLVMFNAKFAVFGQKW